MTREGARRGPPPTAADAGRAHWPAERTAQLAVVTIFVAMAVIELFAASGPSVIVSRSGQSFPGWEAGPLHGLIGHPLGSNIVFDIGSSTLLAVMFAAWVLATRGARRLSRRQVAGLLVSLHALVVIGPPIALTDVFNYLGYARMWALHAVNPYLHGIAAVPGDRVYVLTTWHHLKSPYGPLFTLLTYPLGAIGLPAAYWLLKVGIAAASLGFLAAVWRGANILGRDPRQAVLFVGANPLFLFYALAGFHNDFLMLLPATGAILLVLGRRDRTAGALLALAVAVKLTAVLILPFLLLGAWRSAGGPLRARRVLEGAALAAIPLAAISLLAFGPVLPNLSDQTTLLSDYSFPNVVGWLLGFGGGADVVVRAADLALVASLLLALRLRSRWIDGAGWATLALILTAAWLVPWYIVWLLPLAALGTSSRMRAVCVALTLYLGITFMPAVPPLQRWLDIDPYSGGPGRASLALQHSLSR